MWVPRLFVICCSRYDLLIIAFKLLLVLLLLFCPQGSTTRIARLLGASKMPRLASKSGNSLAYLASGNKELSIVYSGADDRSS